MPTNIDRPNFWASVQNLGGHETPMPLAGNQDKTAGCLCHGSYSWPVRSETGGLLARVGSSTCQRTLKAETTDLIRSCLRRFCARRSEMPAGGYRPVADDQGADWCAQNRSFKQWTVKLLFPPPIIGTSTLAPPAAVWQRNRSTAGCPRFSPVRSAGSRCCLHPPRVADRSRKGCRAQSRQAKLQFLSDVLRPRPLLPDRSWNLRNL